MLKLFRKLKIVPLLILLVIQLFPVLLVVLTSFRSEISLLKYGPMSLLGMDFSNYLRVIQEDHFFDNLLTSTYIALGSTLLTVACGSLAAYGLVRIPFRGRKAFAGMVLGSRMIPPVALAIPVFLLLKKTGYTDTHTGLIMAHTSFSLPFAIWLLIPFFEGIPKGFEEAATIDGCSQWQTFVYVLVPMALPGLLVTAIFCFLLSWNDFLFSLVLAGSQTKTAPLAVNAYMTGFGPEWGPMTAASVLILLPVFVFSLSLQKYLVGGLNAGGVKG